MPVLEFVRLRSCGERQKLVAETDTQDRLVLFHRFSDVRDGLFAHRRVSRPVREEQAVVRFFCEIVIPRHTDDCRAALYERAHDVLFHATIHCDDFGPPAFVYTLARWTYLCDQVFFVRVHERLRKSFILHELAKQHAMLTQAFGQRARIDTRHCRDAGFFEPRCERLFCSAVRIVLRIFGNDEAGYLYPLGFKFSFVRHSVIADERIGEHKYLSGIRWIGQGFGISHHPCIENDFSGRRTFCSKALALDESPVFQVKSHTKNWPVASILRLAWSSLRMPRLTRQKK